MSIPLVSVGIPFLNCENCLLNSVRSIFAQAYTNWELILVDDGSTDSSLDIARSIDDPRVRFLPPDGRNRRLPARLNQITRAAKGDYVARMDADDLCSPKRIEKQLELFQKDPKLDVVGTGMIYLDLDDIPLGDSFAPASHAEICSRPTRKFGLCHPSIMAKKSWYEKNRYDESLPVAQDFDLWLHTYKHSKFANVPEPLYYYRLDQSFNLKKQFTARYVSAAFLFEHYKDTGQLAKALASATIQYGKFAATVLMFATGLRKKLMARRFERLSDADMAFYTQEICKIKSTKLPLQSDEEEG